MSKLSFFYAPDVVFSTSLKALKRRDFKIISSDEQKGLIKAKSKGGILKPEITFEIKIHQMDSNHTNLDIEYKCKKNWLISEGYEGKVEHRLLKTLYKLFDHS